jgi:hypothetical protein
MPAKDLTRRFVLLLPFAAAACGGGDDDDVYDSLRFNDLPPIQLKVTAIAVEQRFIPAGVPPDVSGRDPVQPIDALKAMANDRLQAFGTANKAVFAILDASLLRDNDVVTGSFAVSLTILDDNGTQLGFAQARVQSRHSGRIRELRPVLYDMTKTMMNDMNIEFEYQIRHHLKPWLTDTAAPDTAVDQAPLDGPGGVPVAAPAPAAPPPVPSDTPAYPTAYPPTYLQPPPGYLQPPQP